MIPSLTTLRSTPLLGFAFSAGIFIQLFTPGILSAAEPAPKDPRPNIILIIGDDISADDIGCYGNPGIRTPNIDRLAAAGLTFNNAYVTASSCSPSRCSILSSRYPHNLETAAELHGALSPDVTLLPNLLRTAGYYTAQAGKIHFGNPTGGPGEEAFDLAGLSVDDFGGEGEWVDRLRTRPMDRPFFLWLASHDAHRPWDKNSFNGINRPEDVRVPPYLVDTPETRSDLVHYYDEITRLDHYVGEVMAELERQGISENTMVIVMSDNGRPFPHSKTHLYDDSVKTPFIVHWPAGIAQPAQVNGLLSSIDIAPTVLELAETSKPASFQGVSFVPMLKDTHAIVRDFVFAEKNWHNFTAHMRMVRFGSFVYIRNAWPELPQPGASDTFYNPSADALKALQAQGGLSEAQANIFAQPRSAEELYDLRNDPQQIHNIIATSPDDIPVGKLRAALDRWISETGDTVQTDPTESNIDLATGARKTEFWRGTPPGAAAHALKINRPGPIWDMAAP